MGEARATPKATPTIITRLQCTERGITPANGLRRHGSGNRMARWESAGSASSVSRPTTVSSSGNFICSNLYPDQ
eukprot:7388053-Prymnesium_polylepis.1